MPSQLLILAALFGSCLAFTALDTDNHPCKPENLKVLFSNF
jgi:hypothetical protein